MVLKCAAIGAFTESKRTRFLCLLKNLLFWMLDFAGFTVTEFISAKFPVQFEFDVENITTFLDSRARRPKMDGAICKHLISL